jgi:hypothetical protein
MTSLTCVSCCATLAGLGHEVAKSGPGAEALEAVKRAGGVAAGFVMDMICIKGAAYEEHVSSEPSL